MSSDTIAAIATPPGEGGVAIVRLSGSAALTTAQQLFKRAGGRLLNESHRLVLGSLFDENEVLLDRCLAVWMKAPSTYTGEDVVEFHTHGGSILVAAVLSACLARGARLARPGEFTQRAFLNGKIDLAQAEAVSQLIHSRHRKAALMAAQNLDGALSRKVREIRGVLLDWLSLLEAEIDFGDEIDSFPAQAGLQRCRGAQEAVNRLLESAQGGRAYAEGVSTVLLGPPNAGKSTLLNLLLGAERALVTPIAGTTRDTIEEIVVLGGTVLQLVDTAGIRANPSDLVEQLGIERSRHKAERADLIVLLLDGSAPLPELQDFLNLCDSKELLVLVTKSDLNASLAAEVARAAQQALGPEVPVHCVSLIQAASQQCVLDLIAGRARGATADFHEVFSLTRRQLDALMQCRAALCDVQQTLENGLSAEFVALDLRRAVVLLGEIEGIDVTEEVLDRIFSTFCLGK